MTTPPLETRIELPGYGAVTILEQFAGPHQVRLFVAWLGPGDYLVGFRAGRDRRRDIWLMAPLRLPALLSLLTGEISVREALQAAPGGRMARLAVAGAWGEALADLLPVAAVGEELPPPDLRLDRRWMKGGCPWFTASAATIPAGGIDGPDIARPAAPPVVQASERMPPASSRQRRSGGRMRVWLADAGRR